MRPRGLSRSSPSEDIGGTGGGADAAMDAGAQDLFEPRRVRIGELLRRRNESASDICVHAAGIDAALRIEARLHAARETVEDGVERREDVRAFAQGGVGSYQMDMTGRICPGPRARRSPLPASGPWRATTGRRRDPSARRGRRRPEQSTRRARRTASGSPARSARSLGSARKAASRMSRHIRAESSPVSACLAPKSASKAISRSAR